ncbi:ParM/StbA family protein [uncultured Tissierella sp.]|uniref:ParM/StbA family protein n=1 Tax=uncultured Tissierella sp. TaxID=448160 RepID=UPI00280551FA|nr:ParM/StbA family protein [uncultured Tissierella sp.]MDU5082729.1 ParM/StbA family protein [Bacillota bacterium]
MEESNNIIIGIDHGNKAIKNIITQYNSGFVESNTAPIVKQQLTEYDGKFYSIASDRFPLMINKTVNDKFFILSLPSIAQVLEGVYKGSNTADIILAVGLPIIHYSSNKEQFKNYFIRNNIEFTYNGSPYKVNIKDAYVWAQGYAGLMPYFNQYKGISRINLIDIGGYSVDAFVVEKGILNIKSCISLTSGVVYLFNDIKQEVLTLGMEIQEAQIEEILMGSNTCFIDKDLKDLVCRKAKIFTEELIDKLKEHGFEMKINPNIFMGGGSLLLKEFIEDRDKLMYIEFLDQFSNVRGYEALTRQSVEKGR